MAKKNLDDLAKAALEEEKLREEIKEIQGKRRGVAKSIAISTAILTIIATVITLGIQSSNFLFQREKDLELRNKQFKFSVNNEMIALVQQLNSDKPGQKESAAILLSNFEMAAVPILLKSLDCPVRLYERFPDPNVVINSLELIKNNEVEKEIFLDIVIDESNEIFEREKKGNFNNYVAMNNYINLLCRLGEEKKEIINAQLDSLERDLETTQMDSTIRSVIVSSISECDL